MCDITSKATNHETQLENQLLDRLFESLLLSYILDDYSPHSVVFDKQMLSRSTIRTNSALHRIIGPTGAASHWLRTLLWNSRLLRVNIAPPVNRRSADFAYSYRQDLPTRSHRLSRLFTLCRLNTRLVGFASRYAELQYRTQRL
jgi:hypothetical protein